MFEEARAAGNWGVRRWWKAPPWSSWPAPVVVVATAVVTGSVALGVGIAEVDVVGAKVVVERKVVTGSVALEVAASTEVAADSGSSELSPQLVMQSETSPAANQYPPDPVVRSIRLIVPAPEREPGVLCRADPLLGC